MFQQSFRSRPETARPAALLRPNGPTLAAAARLADREGWEADWLLRAAQATLGPGTGGRPVELPNVKLFAAPPEYVLAVKCAGAQPGDGGEALEDLRFLLRLLNLSSVKAALAVVTQYFAERHLPTGAREALRDVLGA